MMQVLTPSGYRSPATLANGDAVCAFDLATGAAITNYVENIDFVDYAEWCRWWSVEETVPAFSWYRVNGSLMLFREQSVWRNGTEVCHARHLLVGDEIYDDADRPITISTIEEVEDDSLIWYRFDISGDHSYIVDGLTVHNASRFWVGGTGNMDGVSTTHIASTSNGASGASYPGSADSLTLDGSSGGGTVTPTVDHTIQSLVMGAFTGTFAGNTNNKNFTLSTTFNAGGSGIRTINLGNGTYTLTNTGVNTVWTVGITTNLTWNANGSTISCTGSAPFSTRTLTLGGLTYNNISISGSGNWSFGGAATTTINALTLSGGSKLSLNSGGTYNLTSLSVVGTNTAPCLVQSGTLTCTSGTQTMQWLAMQDMTFTGGATFIASNAFDLGDNSGVTITPPSAGGLKYTNDMGGNLG